MSLAHTLDQTLDTTLQPFEAGAICDALAGQGWAVCTLSHKAQLIGSLAQEVARHRADSALEPAGIGRADDYQLARSIRRDRILWLNGESVAQQSWLAFIEQLRLELNRRLMLGLFRHETHFALYEAGGFYRLHRDSFAGARNRLVSTVLYLNEDWHREDGGLLRLYGQDETTLIGEVVPTLGTFVLFLSEDMPHEVTVSSRPRASIAGWFRCNDMIETPALQGAGLADRLG